MIDKEGVVSLGITTAAASEGKTEAGVYDIRVVEGQPGGMDSTDLSIELNSLDDPGETVNECQQREKESGKCVLWRLDFRWGGEDEGDGALLIANKRSHYCFSVSIAESSQDHEIFSSGGDGRMVALDLASLKEKGLNFCPYSCRSATSADGSTSEGVGDRGGCWK